MKSMLVLFPLALLLVCAVPVMLGVYVYRDASSRGMNAVLWTLTAVLAPAFTGFLIYLLVRRSSPRCPLCGEKVAESYTACPQCGARLRPACPGCGAPVEADWRACPRCAQPLPEEWPDIEPPEIPRDQTLGKVLAVIVLVPVLLLAAVMALSISGASGGGFTSWSTVSISDYLAASDHAREVQEWLDVADRSDRAYVLRWTDASAGRAEARYLIYVPQMEENARVSSGVGGSLLGRTLSVEIGGNGDSASGGGNWLLMMSNGGEKPARLQVTLSGKKLPCVITDTDWVLELRTEDVFLT